MDSILTISGEIVVGDVVSYSIHPLSLSNGTTIIKFRTKCRVCIMIPHFETLLDAQEYVINLFGWEVSRDERISQLYSFW